MYIIETAHKILSPEKITIPDYRTLVLMVLHYTRMGYEITNIFTVKEGQK